MSNLTLNSFIENGDRIDTYHFYFKKRKENKASIYTFFYFILYTSIVQKNIGQMKKETVLIDINFV